MIDRKNRMEADGEAAVSPGDDTLADTTDPGMCGHFGLFFFVLFLIIFKQHLHTESSFHTPELVIEPSQN